MNKVVLRCGVIGVQTRRGNQSYGECEVLEIKYRLRTSVRALTHPDRADYFNVNGGNWIDAKYWHGFGQRHARYFRQLTVIGELDE